MVNFDRYHSRQDYKINKCDVLVDSTKTFGQHRALMSHMVDPSVCHCVKYKAF